MTTTRETPTIKIKCPDCPKVFNSSGRMHAHKKRKHNEPRKLVAAPPPAQIVRAVSRQHQTFRAENPISLDDFSLIGADHFDVGDVFWHVRKYVVKEITKFSGSHTVKIKAELTKRHWTEHQP